MQQSLRGGGVGPGRAPRLPRRRCRARAALLLPKRGEKAEELSQILLANASVPRVPGDQSSGRLPDAVRPKAQNASVGAYI